MKLLKIIFFLNLSLFLTSCGFTPTLADNNNSAKQHLEDIEVKVPTTLEGVEFYDHLKNILPFTSKKKKYLLDIQLSYNKAPFVMGENSDILRETKHLTTHYVLYDNSTGQTITNGSFIKIASYSTTFSPYSNTVNKTKAKENLATTAAEEVVSRLSLFFIHKKT